MIEVIYILSYNRNVIKSCRIFHCIQCGWLVYYSLSEVWVKARVSADLFLELFDSHQLHPSLIPGMRLKAQRKLKIPKRIRGFKLRAKPYSYRMKLSGRCSDFSNVFCLVWVHSCSKLNSWAEKTSRDCTGTRNWSWWWIWTRPWSTPLNSTASGCPIRYYSCCWRTVCHFCDDKTTTLLVLVLYLEVHVTLFDLFNLSWPLAKIE